jgi:tRNA U38,U39,U40 pseudouridine synthase TruA
MKTLTDRKIAQEQETTYDQKHKFKDRLLKKETAIADMQAEVVKADQGVQIAERRTDASVKATGDATSVKISAETNAEAIKVNANAEASTTVMG